MPINKIKCLLPVVGLLLISSALNFSRTTSTLKWELLQYKALETNEVDAVEKEVKPTRIEDDKALESDDVLKVWKRYKLEHSNGALRKEWQEGKTKRKFAVGYYSCPLQAGNRLHHFMNSLIWAVVTNRTLLWKYYDEKTCRVAGRKYPQGICRSANSVHDCDALLERAKWLPSLQQWAPRFNLSKPKSLSFWTTHEPSKNHKFWFHGAEKEAGLADSSSSRFVEFPQMLGQDAWVLHSERKRKILLTSSEARHRAELLFRAGADYLYGLLFFDCFAFQPSVSVDVRHGDSKDVTLEELGDSRGKASVSIVVHSRHPSTQDSGSSIKREKRCLDQILANTSGFCQVMILSDRPRTLVAVESYLNAHYPHCHALVAPHQVGTSFSQEHGVFAGAGFYQDLAMISNQTLHVPTSITAFAGFKYRSSSELVRELMTFQLHQQARSRNATPTITTCYLEEM